jgi:putative transposase
MKRARFTDEQIVRILQEADRAPVAEVAKRQGVSEPSMYAQRKKFGDMGTDDVKRLKQLEQENNRLKKIVAELDLEIEVMRAELQEKSGERADAFGVSPVCHWPECDSKTSLYADERCPIGVGVRVQDAG